LNPFRISITFVLMPVFLYNIFLALYTLGIKTFARVNAKARKWVSGREHWQLKLQALKPNEQRIWIHCSSLGEFEQGRPLIEQIKKQYPHYKIVLTFFSPSGYETCKDYDNADYIYYLPMDGKANAQQFITAVNPALALFVKYEFWYYYLAQLKMQSIPTLLVSAAFRVEQPFFKWYGGLFRNMLGSFTYLFVQDWKSKTLLQKIGFTDKVIVAGDTRYDRVSAIAENLEAIPSIVKFKGATDILIAGSTWPGDEEILWQCLPCLPESWKLIIAPHEVHEEHIKAIQERFGSMCCRFSNLGYEANYLKKVLIIDNMGMLSSLYAYGTVAYVGGGFQKGGIHNILEPAVFGLPIIFGPVYEKFVEAVKLVSLEFACPVNDVDECAKAINKYVLDNTYRTRIHEELKSFMQQSIGATKIIEGYVKECLGAP
jgi:3-deoxy-D-manno-octulosonic-acid transferase